MFTRILLLSAIAIAALAQPKTPAPRIWNDRDLAEWATPVAALKVRPGHLSEKEYYAVPPGDWVRSYPVYFPGREPEGYWQMLQSKKPEPLIAPGARTESEWIEAGRRAFEEMDVPASAPTTRNSSPRSAPPRNSRNSEATRRRTAPCSAGDGFPLRKGRPCPFPSVPAVTPGSCPMAAGCTARKATIRATICFLRCCNQPTRSFSRETPKPWRPGASLPFLDRQ